MRRFLLSLLFVGALSAVFSFSAFAGTQYVESSFMSSGQVVYTDRASYSVSASPGDIYYVDLSVSTGYESILTSSGVSITSSVYNRDFSSSYSIEAIGSSYGAADVVMEGNRAWIFFNRSVPSITLTFQITLSASWYGGTLAEQSPYNLSDCIARIPFTVSFSALHSYSTGNPTDVSISNQLNKVLDALGASPTYPYLQDAIWYISSQYFESIWTDTAIVPGSDGYFVLNDGTYSRLILSSYDGSMAYTLSPGTYIFSFSFYADQKPSYVSIGGVKLSDVSIIQDWAISNKYLVSGLLDVDRILSGRELAIDIGVNFSSGVVYGGLAPYSTDAIAGDAMNPEQDGIVSDVDNAGEQQSQQEDEMWQNINTYKGDISFNLDGWDDAAGGLSYVTGVFMTIWNNSPTQPIVLSLMLGIAMLSIGRGVMAAVRVSRNRGDD